MNSRAENNNARGLSYSITIHLLLLGVCYFAYITVPFPKEEIETGGIVINYGTSGEGMGDNYTSMEEPAVGEEISSKIVEDPNRPDSREEINPVTTEKKVVTQDFEEAPEIKSNEAKQNSSTSATSPTETKTQPVPVVEERALFKGKKNQGTGTGDGTGNVPGNQGKKTGSVLSDSYTGDGSGGGGVALNLEGRRFLTRPSIQDDGQQSGKIVVQINVNKDGKVTDARAGVRGTTITNAVLWEKCEKAVLGAKLNALTSAPDIQIGTVVFTFILK